MINKDILKAFLLIFGPYLAVISTAFFVFLSAQNFHYLRLIQENEVLQIDLARKSIERDLEAILPDIEILVNQRHVQQYINLPLEPARQLIEEEFSSFSHNKRIYRQIRLLDTSGMEVVRIDNLDGKPLIRNRPDLQNKHDRYYFRETIKLAPGELYISPLDLNIDKGEIEIPHYPTIGFAMPVYDNDNVLHAVVVLNYKASNLLSNFDEMLEGSYGHIALLNQEGYWLRSHKQEREWGFMYGNNMQFGNRHPEEWQAISENDHGQIKSADGLFTYSSIYPLDLIGGYGDKNADHSDHKHDDRDAYVWKIVSDVPESTLYANFRDQIFGPSGLIWLLLTTMGIFTSLYLAQTYIERKKLRKEKELHAKIYNTSTDGIIITDESERIIDINEAFEEISGYTRDEVIGKTPGLFSSGQHNQEFYIELWRTLQLKGYWEGEIYNRHKDGGIYTEWIRMSAIKDKNEETTNYIALVSDITHKKSTEEQLLKHAHHDPLTGAYNRLSFDQRFRHDLALAERNNRKLAILFIDLDKFKPINDTYGHQAGDAVLQTVVERVSEKIRDTDTLARLGGDEFVVLLSEIEDDENAEQIAHAIRAAIAQPIIHDETPLNLTASIGISVYPRDGSNVSALLGSADKSMYEAKQAQKKNVTT
jgi:diguanylate cyclase (GGDEF)-like protein/PAS domain S-box-containing protein